jgi:hypothetical protein
MPGWAARLGLMHQECWVRDKSLTRIARRVLLLLVLARYA